MSTDYEALELAGEFLGDRERAVEAQEKRFDEIDELITLALAALRDAGHLATCDFIQRKRRELLPRRNDIAAMLAARR